MQQTFKATENLTDNNLNSRGSFKTADWFQYEITSLS